MDLIVLRNKIWKIDIQYDEVDLSGYTDDDFLHLKLSFDYGELLKLLHPDNLI